MALSDSLVCFPDNILTVLGPRLHEIDPGNPDPRKKDDGVRVKNRPLRTTDTTLTIGLAPIAWTPTDSSVEIMGGRFEPTIQRYTIAVQSMVKDSDEERGIATHSRFAALVRSMLYRDRDLDIELHQLKVTLNGATETLKRWGVGSQQYLNNEINREFVFLSVAELWVETELERF